MKSNKKLVMAKKIQFMIPNAKLALSIAQVLLMLTENGLDPLKPFGPRETNAPSLVEKLEQLALEMPRSS